MNDFMPHGVCFLWNSGLIAFYVVANFLVAFAYFLIPAGFLLRKSRAQESWMGRGLEAGFAAFIMFCGLSHVWKLLVIWHPWYWAEAAWDMATGLLSLWVALRFVPAILKRVRGTPLGALRDLRKELKNTRFVDTEARRRMELVIRKLDVLLDEKGKA